MDLNKTVLLKLENVTVTLGGQAILKNVSLTIKTGEIWAIVGKSGSGKTTLANTIMGTHFYSGTIQKDFSIADDLNKNIVLITQQHSFKNLSNTSTFYYQQRFNSYDSQDALTVHDQLKASIKTVDIRLLEIEDKISKVLNLLAIDYLKNTPLIQLSNGEHKRLQIAKGLLQNPQLLILDNPFVGLDVAARNLLHTIINKLLNSGVNILLITTPDEVSNAVTHVAVLNNGSIEKVLPRATFIKENLNEISGTVGKKIKLPAHLSINTAFNYPSFKSAVKMIDVQVEYNGKKILDNINWEVKKGECWSLSGHNGAGKSTLLSLINGDNPKAYANKIYLFDRKRGTGESIWDIKKKTGYVSPELHNFFDKSISCYAVVASGLFDTIGLFKKLTVEQQKLVEDWMSLLEITTFKHKLLTQVSAGEQRMVLLARALVKNPPLLILDEPCQGLDKATAENFIVLIDALCKAQQKTLIYVSHYQEEIPSCVQYSLKLEQGKIVA